MHRALSRAPFPAPLPFLRRNHPLLDMLLRLGLLHRHPRPGHPVKRILPRTTAERPLRQPPGSLET